MMDFDQFSLTEPAFLVTIVSEAILKDSIVKLLHNLKVKGYTVRTVESGGRYARRLVDPDQPEPLNAPEPSIEVQVIVSEELANVLLYALKEQQRDFAIFAYRQKVETLIQD